MVVVVVDDVMRSRHGLRRNGSGGNLALSDQGQSLLGYFEMMLAPLYPPVLEPHFDLCLGQLKCVGQVETFWTDHVLLPFEFGLQTFQLFRGENGPDAFTLKCRR